MDYKINKKTGKIDFLNGDHSFKNWLNIMAVKNIYLELFIVALVLLIIEIANLGFIWYVILEAFADSIFAGLLCSFGSMIPITMIFFISYLAFYKFWKQLKGDL